MLFKLEEFFEKKLELKKFLKIRKKIKVLIDVKNSPEKVLYDLYITICNPYKGINSPYHCTKIKFSIEDFFSKCDRIGSFLWIWSHLLKRSLKQNFIFCAVYKFPFLKWFRNVPHAGGLVCCANYILLLRQKNLLSCHYKLH